MEASESDRIGWFDREVRPHERGLRTYLKRTFPSVRDVDDIVQESFLRIWQARQAHPIRSARPFLFRIAHRLAIDYLRRQDREKNGVHDIVTRFYSVFALGGEPGVIEALGLRQEIAVLAEAVNALPARCRQIFVLRKLEGMSHRQIAIRLGISEETVQVQLGRGMHKCGQFLRRRNIRPRMNSEFPLRVARR